MKSHQTEGIILVGAHPWTRSAFDGLLPRTLLPVAHRPLISYGFSWLQEGGIQEVAVCANRETQALQAQLLRHVPRGMTLSYHEDAMPRGAAGAVRDAARASDAATFVVTDGTAIPTVDLRDLLTAHQASGAAVTVVVHSEPSCLGEPHSQAPSGMYVFDRHALDVVPDRGFYDIKENLIPALHRSGERVHAYAARSASPRVLNAASYLAVNEWMVEQVVAAGSQPEGYVKTGECLFHRDAVIAGDATFIGPVLVGAGARIMSGAVVVGPTSIGCEAVLGPCVLVSRSAIWRRSVVHEQAVADQCLVADDSVVDAGTHAVRTVMVAHARRELPKAREATLKVREKPSLEMLGKMIRYRLGAWSRSAAAE